jgi:hypothetical protein
MKICTTYTRKKKDLQQTYKNITVPGIITNVQKYILPTDSVIVDSLLGQGEALDCYNMKLQEAATQNAVIDNNIKLQMLDIINKITDPIAKTEAYKKVFGTCCATPQCACGCNPKTL